MLRRAWLLFGLVTFLLGPRATTLRGDENPGIDPAPAAFVADLREQLRSGLRAARASDREYIERVVLLVQQGQLSRGLVNYAYTLSVKRRPDYPLPYFQRLLRALAMRQGVSV